MFIGVGISPIVTAPPAITLPKDMPFVKRWYRADNVTEASGVVTQFNDMLGGTDHATAAAGQRGTKVLNALGNMPGVTISGGQRYKIPALTVDKFTICCVWKHSVTTAGLIYEKSFNAAAGGAWFWASGSNFIYVITDVAHQSGKTRATLADNLFRITYHHFDGTNTGHICKTYGKQEATSQGILGGSGAPTSLTSLGSQDIWWGARSDGTFATSGTISEFILFDPNVTPAVEYNLNTYFEYMYGQRFITNATDLVLLGDSTVSGITGAQGVDKFTFTSNRNPTGTRVVNLAASGHMISHQEAVWRASSFYNSGYSGVVYIRLGLNNNAINQSLTAETAEMTSLIAAIRIGNPQVKICLGVVSPAYQRWINLFGAGATADAIQATWSQFNDRIRANYWGVDAIVAPPQLNTSAPSDVANDGTGRLKSMYEISPPDGIHWNDAARTLDGAGIMYIIKLLWNIY